jgi:glycosyltransferase involved in cell wall biosynthesis
MPYIKTCVDTIVLQNYLNYELIISDDNSTDGTSEFIDSLIHPHIKILHTPYRMSMTEHWEWVLSHAQGEWCIFVGQDDGLQLYFFELADILTRYAEHSGVRVIMSQRAYFFWPGCHRLYADTQVHYTAAPIIEHCNSKWKVFQTLTGALDGFYFELPAMYTSSLFHHSLLDEARARQQGKVFVTHPQDANLAAIGCCLEAQYIRSGIPLGWVGTSPKSAGMAVSEGDNASELRRFYLDKIHTSQLEYCPLIGSFSLRSYTLYFWGALVKTEALQGRIFRAFVRSALIKYFVLSAAKYEVSNRIYDGVPHNEFEKICEINACSEKILNISYKIYILYRKVCIYLLNKLRIYDTEQFSFYTTQGDNISIVQSSETIMKNVHNYILSLKK